MNTLASNKETLDARGVQMLPKSGGCRARRLPQLPDGTDRRTHPLRTLILRARSNLEGAQSNHRRTGLRNDAAMCNQCESTTMQLRPDAFASYKARSARRISCSSVS